MSTEYLSIAQLRNDGRRVHELRRIRSRFNLFPKVDGSAYLEQGQTKVIGIVYGPRERMNSGGANAEPNDLSIIKCSFSQASFATTERKDPTFKGDRKSMEISLALKQIFESTILRHLYPRTQIDLAIEVIQSDGGLFSACVNVLSLALIDAGIAVSDFVVSCNAALIQHQYFQDLNYQEENSSTSSNYPNLTIAYMPRTKKLNFIQLECKLPLVEFERLIKTAKKGCEQVYEILQESAYERTAELLNTRNLS